MSRGTRVDRIAKAWYERRQIRMTLPLDKPLAFIKSPAVDNWLPDIHETTGTLSKLALILRYARRPRHYLSTNGCTNLEHTVFVHTWRICKSFLLSLHPREKLSRL